MQQSEHLKSSVRDLGESLSDLLQVCAATLPFLFAVRPACPCRCWDCSCQSMGAVQKNPDPSSRRELAAAARAVGGAVAGLLSALQAGSRGTQACLSALSSLDTLVVDLETTAMFASAGLNAIDCLLPYRQDRSQATPRTTLRTSATMCSSAPRSVAGVSLLPTKLSA